MAISGFAILFIQFRSFSSFSFSTFTSTEKTCFFTGNEKSLNNPTSLHAIVPGSIDHTFSLETQMPMFHDWPKLKDLARTDRPLMVRLALLDLAMSSERDEARKHPEYFFYGDEEVAIPLSIFRVLALHRAMTGKGILYFPVSRDKLGTPGEEPMKYSLHFTLLGLETLESRPLTSSTADLVQGSEIEHGGRQMVVFERNEKDGLLFLVPRSRVDPTC